MSTELNRNLGVGGIVLMVVAAAAPITVVAANFGACDVPVGG